MSEKPSNNESSGFLRLSAEAFLILMAILTGLGLQLSEETDCLDKARHSEDLAVCDGEAGTILMGREGGEVVLSQKLVCDSRQVTLYPGRAHAYRNNFDEIIVTYIDPQTLELKTVIYEAGGFFPPDCW